MYNGRKAFLCTCMGCKMTLAIHVILHYMADFKLDPLIYIFLKKPYLSSKIARWKVFLVEYDIMYMTRKVVKGSVIADHLADNAIEDYEPLNFDFPNEDVSVVEKEEELD